MFNFSTSELIIVLIIALVVFGPGKLPEVGKAIGKGINEFKDAVNGEKTGKSEQPKAKETIEAAAVKNENNHKEVEGK